VTSQRAERLLEAITDYVTDYVIVNNISRIFHGKKDLPIETKQVIILNYFPIKVKGD